MPLLELGSGVFRSSNFSLTVFFLDRFLSFSFFLSDDMVSLVADLDLSLSAEEVFVDLLLVSLLLEDLSLLSLVAVAPGFFAVVDDLRFVFFASPSSSDCGGLGFVLARFSLGPVAAAAGLLPSETIAVMGAGGT